jgi:hypothetical protein
LKERSKYHGGDHIRERIVLRTGTNLTLDLFIVVERRGENVCGTAHFERIRAPRSRMLSNESLDKEHEP